MPTNKEAAQVLAHPNGQRCELTQMPNLQHDGRRA